MKNEKGFTLVELLVSITILGIILAIALPQLTSLQQDNKDTKYKKYAESVITSAKLYTDSYHKDMFGNNSSGCYDIPYSKLEAKSLVKDINVDDATCNTYAADGVTELTYVRVFKSNENYLYNIAIRCNDKDGKEVYREILNADICDGTRTDTDGPTITIEKVDNWTTGKNASGNPLKATVKISDSFGLKENVKVEYAWTKTPDNLSSLSFTQKAFKNSREDLVQNLSFTVDYPQNQNGEWYLIVRPVGDEGLRDANGNYYSDVYTKSTPVLLDNTKPVITNTTNNSSGNWIKGTAVVTATAKDDHSGLKSIKYTYNSDGKSSLRSDWKTGITPGTKGPVTVTKEWTTELNQTIYIVAEDRVGNKSIVKNSGSVKLDNTGPTCSISVNSSQVTLETGDSGGSSVSTYGLTTSSTPTYNRIASQSIATGTFNGYVKDAASNEGSCSITIETSNLTCPDGYENLGDTCGKFTGYECKCVCCVYNQCQTNPLTWTYYTPYISDCTADCYTPCSIANDLDVLSSAKVSEYDEFQKTPSCSDGYTLVGTEYCYK